MARNLRTSLNLVWIITALSSSLVWYILCLGKKYQGAGMHRFFKNLGATNKFFVPEVWHECSVLRFHYSWATCEPQFHLAPSAPHMGTSTYFWMEGKNYRDYAGNIRCHIKKFSWLDFWYLCTFHHPSRTQSSIHYVTKFYCYSTCLAQLHNPFLVLFGGGGGMFQV
jgi:hypothetical protein